jgi:hypothetical protein
MNLGYFKFKRGKAHLNTRNKKIRNNFKLFKINRPSFPFSNADNEIRE